MRALALVLLATLALPSPAGAQAQSFDCAKAKTDIERAVCADPALAALDRRMVEAHAAAERRLASDPKAVKILREEQADFVEERDYSREVLGRKVDGMLKDRAAELDAIVEARPGFEGRWLTSDGEVIIVRRPDGRYRVVVEVDPGISRCEFNGVGTLRGGRMRVVWNIAEDREDGAEGWTLELRREGALLTMAERRNRSEVERPPYCGARGGLDELRFFPARPKA
jgi:uncharacterized protein YecT (DUF1311 family)